ncbi:hypothetical protein [Jiangella muralis]|uniref:hypothetical protein n=1 Tax=Jiangella muralis TaxID=702383 RepID=UPI00069D339C|nr:hypothetical protein [Jiangella muralis]
MEQTTAQRPSAPRPSVGRAVHYVSYGTPGGEYRSQCRAAVITETGDDDTVVGLAVINPTGMFFQPLASGGCRQEEDTDQHPGGTWHWPERVG